MAFPFFQLFFNSLIAGSIYALVAVGFSLIYSTNRYMHFAHGASVVVASYIMLSTFTFLKIPFLPAAILTILAAGGFGWVMYRTIYHSLQKRKSSNVILLIASIGLLILFENIIMLLFGPEVRSLGFPPQTGILFLGARITPIQIYLITTTLVLLILFYFCMKKTTLGRNLRAVADNKQLASIMGLNVNKLMGISFFIGSALAGIAGILVSLEQNMNPIMGTKLMIKGFSGAVIGGILSVPGSIVGSLVVGFAENFGVWFLPSGFKETIAFTLLFLFLLFKPSGIFGFDKGVRG